MPGSPPPTAVPTRSVLLISPIDDERAMYGEYLRSRGFDVTVQREPSAAIATASGGVHAVVARVRQDGPLDGIALTRALRSDVGESLAIVLISTYVDPAVRRLAVAAGCDRFFLLPCSPGALTDGIEAAIIERADPRLTTVTFPTLMAGMRSKNRRR